MHSTVFKVSLAFIQESFKISHIIYPKFPYTNKHTESIEQNWVNIIYPEKKKISEIMAM